MVFSVFSPVSRRSWCLRRRWGTKVWAKASVLWLILIKQKCNDDDDRYSLNGDGQELVVLISNE